MSGLIVDTALVVPSKLSGKNVMFRSASSDLFNEPFAYSDGTTLNNLVPAWAVDVNGVGSVSVTGAKVLTNGILNGMWASVAPAVVSNTNHYAAVEISAGLAGNIGGVLARFTDKNNFYALRCSRAAADTYELYKRVASTYTLLDSLVEAFPATPFRVKLGILGTTLTGYLWNGSAWVQKVTKVGDAAFASGSVGIFGQYISGAQLSFDDFAAGNT